MNKENNMKTIKVQEHGLTFEGHPEDGKSIADELRRLIEEDGNCQSTTLNDFTFALEVEYQEFYGLDEDDWGRKED